MWRLFLIMIVSLALFTPLGAAAQDSALAGMDENAITILNAINNLRRQENRVILVPNAGLNQLADFFANDVAARSADNLGDTFLTRTGENLETLLARYNYPAYPDNYYAADFVSLVLRIEPKDIVTYWNTNWRTDTTLYSRQMVRRAQQSLQPTLPIFDRSYREIGIAYRQTTTNNTTRYSYVLVFGAQPNVLPIAITDPDALSDVTQTITSPNVAVYISNEANGTHVSGEIIGDVQNIHISEQPGEPECPTGIPPSDWQPYQNLISSFPLSESFGLKTIYVVMCDAAGKRVMSQASVLYSDQPDAVATLGATAVSGPDVVGIAHATQTAAASATAYAPFLVTVEAILTGTASAP